LLNKKDMQNSVVIIPNSRLYDYCDPKEIDFFFLKVISYLSNHGYQVIILKHSADDSNIVKNIGESVCNLNNILILADDYEIEVIDEVLSSAFFVISGRYHGLVASLKNSVPCVATGWADKYNELMDIFDLNDYLFDFRLKCKVDLRVIDKIIENREALVSKIKNKNLKLAKKYPLKKFINYCNVTNCSG